MPRGSSFQSLIGLLGRFQVIITLVVISALGVIAAASMIFTGREVTRSMIDRGDAEARDILRVIHLNLENQKSGLDFFKNYAEQQYRQRLRDLVGVVVSEVDYFYTLQESGLMSEEQAKTAALDAVQKMRYGHNDYFFIYDRNNVAISHPDPNVRGRDMSQYTDINGRPVSETMWEMARKQPDGFLTMWWTRLGETRPVPKLLYFYHDPKWDWMIGTGLYIDDIDRDVEKKMAEIMNVLKRTFSQVRVEKTGYFTLFDSKGKLLIHPFLENTDGSKMLDPTTGKNHLKALLAASRDPDIPLKYLWDKPDNPGKYQYLKYSHVERFAPFDWYISSSVYQDEMEQPAKKILRRQTIFVGLILLAAAVCVYFLVSRVTSPLARLARYADLLQKRNFSLPEEEKRELLDIHFPYEVRHLARTFRDMEERLDRYLKHLEETTAAREKIESELRIARSIQMSMLPDWQRVLHGQPEIDLAAILEPAREVGGDLYDFFMIGPDRFCFLVGDVSDKGVPAALFMARCKAILRSAACRTGATPDVILTEANRELIEGNELMMFLTVSLGILDLSTGELTLSNAGHVSPALLGRDGRRDWIETPPGKPLGITGRARFATRRHILKPGDGLLIVTDGVTEAENRSVEFFGDERLLESLRGMDAVENAGKVVDTVLHDVRAFAEGAPQSDDIAILCIRYLGRRTFRRSLEIGAAESASGIIRLLDEAESFLEASGLPGEMTFDFRVVMEELMTNLLQYGSPADGGSVEAALELALDEDVLRATISDSGPPFDPLEAADADPAKRRAERKIGGLGLHLVRRLMDELDYQRLEDRNVLRMTKKIG